MERQKQSRACSPPCVQFMTSLCSLFIKWPSIINAAVTCCSATQQVGLKSTHKHSLENLHLVATTLSPLMLLRSHCINFITDVLMLFKVTLGRRSAAWSSAKQKFTASVTDYVTQGRSRRRFERERLKESLERKMDKEEGFSEWASED